MSSLTRNRHSKMVLLSGKRSTVLEDAEAYWDLRYYDGGTSLRDMQGRHPAVLGSSAGADSNDPLYLPYAGTPYLYLPGTSGNYASVPDFAGNRPTGDLWIYADFESADYSFGADQTVGARWTSSGNQRSELLSVEGTGKLRVQWTVDGTNTTAVVVDSTVTLQSVGVTDDSRVQFYATLDVDNGAGGYEVKFYWRVVGGVWAQLGATVVGGATTSVFAGTGRFETSVVGGAGQVPIGNLYSVRMGTGLVLDANTTLSIDFTDLSAYNAARTSLTAVTGQTVTINRSATGRKSAVVERNDFLGATDDYAEGSITLTGYPFAMVWAGRGYATAAADALFTLTDASAANVMYGIHTDASGNFGMRAQNTTAQDAHESGTKYDDGLFHVVVAVFRSATDRELYIDGVSAATDTNSVTFNTAIDVFSISRWGDSSPSGYADCEFIGAGIWFREPTLQEIKRLNYEWAV